MNYPEKKKMHKKMFLFFQVVLILIDSSAAGSVPSENDHNTNFSIAFDYDSRHVQKRSINNTDDGYTYLNIGVLMASHLGGSSPKSFKLIIRKKKKLRKKHLQITS